LQTLKFHTFLLLFFFFSFGTVSLDSHVPFNPSLKFFHIEKNWFWQNWFW
jgi:hypothetical protein